MKFKFDLEEIKYAKIEYKGDDGILYVKKLVIKTISNREILACARFEGGLNISTPQNVTISFVCNDGLYRTKTNLKTVEKDEPYNFFILETPENIEFEQNREYFRVNAKYKCKYKIDDEHEYNAETIDLSANGVCLALPADVSTRNIADIMLIFDNRFIPIKARFIRSEKNNDIYQTSFAYIKIAEQDRDFISQVCIKKQLEQRRNQLK